ncbi:MBL fold metallo-hydrolase [Microbacterium sp. ASV81]|uniref:MBL fold metallo-hydrolase n=1 Tax=Microbacterium capsulatum TaxID=3041921 RepID=A0ABU0XJ31_9MICO|nr:MBL fold metallo-hydrolase [Microbacterium sp. ASV81]MDQ4213680.1 MBL fold metallo-hydrolase [Microbacterium sp. ASV81]
MSDEAVIRSLSTVQQTAWDRGEHSAPEEVAADVWAFAVPIPGGMLPSTLGYALLSADGGVHLIDPGWPGDDAFDAVSAALATIGRRMADVRTVIATHFHPDHLGLCGRIRNETGAAVMFSADERLVLAQETAGERRDRASYDLRLEAWGVPEDRRDDLRAEFDRPALVADLDPDRLLRDGDAVDLPGHALRVVTTPGHTGGHVCLVDEHRGLIYVGDHVLPRIYSGVGIGTLRPEQALAELIDSLDRLAPYDDLQVLPGHEFRYRGLGVRRAEIVRHHLRRTREVAALLPELGDAPIWEYARRMTWTGGWAQLRGFSLHSALRQTAMHLELVRTGRAEGLFAREG